MLPHSGVFDFFSISNINNCQHNCILMIDYWIILLLKKKPLENSVESQVWIIIILFILGFQRCVFKLPHYQNVHKWDKLRVKVTTMWATSLLLLLVPFVTCLVSNSVIMHPASLHIKPILSIQFISDNIRLTLTPINIKNRKY